MAKPTAAQDDPARAFRKAWKLLGQLEGRLGAARKDEAKRRRQLAQAKGARALKRQGQLEAALAEIAQVEALLTELSELIAANARARSGRTVGEMAHEAAEAVKAEALAATAAVAHRAAPAEAPPAAESPAPDWTPPDEPPAYEPPADEPPADVPAPDEPPAYEPPADVPAPDEPPAYEPIPADVELEPPADVQGSVSG